jgi:hypothetical protein
MLHLVVQGPEGYRAQAFKEICSCCNEFGTATCKRCGAPLCDQHRHGKKRRCPDCEVWFDENREALLTRRAERRMRGARIIDGLLAWLAAPLLLGGALTFLIGWGNLLAAVVGLTSFSAGLGVWRYSQRFVNAVQVRLAARDVRRNFLADRARPALVADSSRAAQD